MDQSHQMKPEVQSEIFQENPYFNVFIQNVNHDHFLSISTDEPVKMWITPYKKYLLKQNDCFLPEKANLMDDEFLFNLEKGRNFVYLNKHLKIDKNGLNSINNIFVYFEMFRKITPALASGNGQNGGNGSRILVENQPQTHLEISYIDYQMHFPLKLDKKIGATLIENKELVFTFSHQDLKNRNSELGHIQIEFEWDQYPP